MRVDFHIHTTASDGRHTPREIFELADARKLKAFSITDHDTVSGIPEALEVASEFPRIIFIPGVEIASFLSDLELHILGYYINHTSPALTDFLANQRLSREVRAKKILLKLEEMGMPLKWERVKEIAKGQSVGRPHIAIAMIEKGYVSSVKEAFTLYLGRGASAYVPREKATPHQVVEVISKAGGIAVIAHPLELIKRGLPLERLIEELKPLGLVGIEAYYNGYKPEESEEIAKIARKYDLIALGGSDYHGIEPMDTPIGAINIPEEEIERFLAIGGRLALLG